ncbi:formyltetrahydrofolate synthetase [Clostridium saccharoperbutylacetonicum]|uniref:Uncharacterized protein n=1 Tax=Clostridium saccharoperbutylacetonicum N1-4(HMT) TaxID=931276 RepID=M1MLB0_9CLOT|nr:hypothetical protein Cspa_c49460 [Clostridium saccharoperbutylacetonicum N1-4(HMT)]NRT60522.1 formyltetrahydrofolate synthetase [Clostridium saccharoperbutylacetonicum]NSB23836.1 formyltetrahydrofolate synthetase [Clostridium saccharoperbutylacetonicum]NSB43212.1 formyltetrahydrofolate synthetase [Clostridium saccharoperbutylacetonicum]
MKLERLCSYGNYIAKLKLRKLKKKQEEHNYENGV